MSIYNSYAIYSNLGAKITARGERFPRKVTLEPNLIVGWILRGWILDGRSLMQCYNIEEWRQLA